jgi:hypothetical protein
MDSYKFKLQGTSPQELAAELPVSQDVIFQGQGSVISQTLKDNHDQTKTIISNIKVITMEVRPSEYGAIEAPVFKDVVKQKSWSKKVRDRLYILHTKLGGTDDTFEAFYAQKMEKYCDFVDTKIDEADGH